MEFLQHVNTFFLLSMQFVQQHISTILLLSGIVFFILLVLGATNVMLVFRDTTDFFWSILIVVAPFVTFIGLQIAEPSRSPADYNLLWGTLNAKIITVLGGAITAWALVKTFKHCLQNNGVALGLVLFAFKIMASVLLVILIFGVLYNMIVALFGKKSDMGVAGIFIIIFGGIFGFLVERLINGDRFLQRQEQLRSET